MLMFWCVSEIRELDKLSFELILIVNGHSFLIVNMTLLQLQLAQPHLYKSKI